MRQNWGKLISRLGLSFAGSIAVSAGAVSIFIGTSKGDSKQLDVVQPKNNTTTQGNNSPAIQGSSNTTTINSGNTTNHTLTDKRSQPQYKIQNDNRYQQHTKCSSVNNGSACTNNGTMNNQFNNK